MKNQKLKIALLSILTFIQSSVMGLTQPIFITIKNLEGKVEQAVWRNEIKLQRFFATEKNKPNEESLVMIPQHWEMVISNIKGVTVDEKQLITGNFSLLLPIDGFKHFHVVKDIDSFKDDKMFLSRIKANNKLNIKIGSNIKFENLILSGADIIDDVKFDKLFIDGKLAIDNTQKGKINEINKPDSTRVKAINR